MWKLTKNDEITGVKTILHSMRHNTNIGNQLYEQVKNIETCTCSLALLGQWLSIAAYEKRLWDIDNFLVNRLNSSK